MTAYIISLTSKTGIEVNRDLGGFESLQQATEEAHRQMDTLLEGRGLLTAWTVYTAEDSRLMASWVPQGHLLPEGHVLAGLALLA